MGTGKTVRRGFVMVICMLGCAVATVCAEPTVDAAKAPGESVVSGNPAEPVTIGDAPPAEVAEDAKLDAAKVEAPARKKLLLPDPVKPVDTNRSSEQAAPSLATRPSEATIEIAPQESLPLGGSPSTANAESGTLPLAGTTNAGDTSKPGSSGWALQTLSALAVVIALIFGLRMLLQKMTGQSPVGPASRVVEVLARTTIAPKSSVILVKVGGSVLAVGHTPNGLNTLAEFDDPGDVASLLSQVSASKPLSITESFRSVLHGADAGYDDADEPDEDTADRTHEQVNGLLARMRSFGKRDSA